MGITSPGNNCDGAGPSSDVSGSIPEAGIATGEISSTEWDGVAEMRGTNTLPEAAAPTERDGVAEMRGTNTLPEDAALTEGPVAVDDGVLEINGTKMLPVTCGLTDTCEPGDVDGVAEIRGSIILPEA